MKAASRKDIVRLFPGIQDHTVLEILHTGTNIHELEAALQLLQNDDEGLIGMKQRQDERIGRLLAILRQSEIRPLAEDR
ncbi:MAG: hypothetical protein GWN47_04815 [Woeseiaceae bacterium]|nr:hypothetical protein [Woeseiaceae bacterium]